MLNPFPQLLMFGFFAPTLLRVVAAAAFAYLAVMHYKRREHLQPTIAWLLVLVEALVAVSLFIGYGTQYGALAGAIVAAGQGITAKRYKHATPLCMVDYIFLVVICLSLLISGAGALAFDLPL